MESKVKKIKEIIAEKVGVPVEDIKPESDLESDLNAGILEIADITMKLKEEFQIEIPEEEIKKITTVNDFINLIADEE
jgi:acyl carrier protein